MPLTGLLHLPVRQHLLQRRRHHTPCNRDGRQLRLVRANSPKRWFPLKYRPIRSTSHGFLTARRTHDVMQFILHQIESQLSFTLKSIGTVRDECLLVGRIGGTAGRENRRNFCRRHKLTHHLAPDLTHQPQSGRRMRVEAPIVNH